LKKIIPTILIIIINFFSTSLNATIQTGTLKEYIGEVAVIEGMNIIIDEELNDEVQIILTEPPRQTKEALKSLLDERGFTLEQKGNYYLITKTVTKLPDKIKIFKTKRNPQQLQEEITPILDSFFTTKKYIKDTNNTTDPYTTQERKDSIQDVAPNYQLRAVNNALILSYRDPKILETTKEILKETDKLQKRLNVEARIYNIKTSYLREIGIKYGLFREVATTIGDFTNSLILGAGGTPLSFVKGLEDNTSFYMVSAPSISLLEGTTGQTENTTTYPVLSQNDTIESNFQNRDTQKYEDITIGSTFKVTFKRIVSDFIEIDLHFQDETFLKYVNDRISYNTTNIESSLMLKDQEEILLASSSKLKRVYNNSGIPFLKDLPYVGPLFQFDAQEQENITTIIHLKVKII
jgi:type II secretory pathway component GspD/PulD (secretin)